MMKKLIYSVALIVMGLTSCLDDEGTYNYLDLNQVNEIANVDEAYSVNRFEDVLEIMPEIKFAHNNDANYKYEWSLNYETDAKDGNGFSIKKHHAIVISTEKNLKFTANYSIPCKEYVAVLKITNTETGVDYKKDFTIRVQNAYEYGYFFLCEKGDDSEMFLINDKGTAIPEIFTLLTGDVVKGKPLQMEKVRKGNELDLVVFTNTAPNYGAVFNWKTLEYNWPAFKCFHKGMVNEPFNVNCFVAGTNIFTVVNGQYYFTAGMSQSEYRPYISLDVPDLDESVDYVNAERSFPLLHTSSGNIYAPGSYGKISKVMQGGNQLNIPGKCVHIGAEPIIGGGKRSHIIVKDSNGGLKDAIVETKTDYSTWPFTVTFSVIALHDLNFSDLVNDDIKFVSSNSERYFYFSSDNKIYRYNYDAPADTPALIAELPVGQQISYLYLEYGYTVDGRTGSYYDDKFIVATYDNSGEKNGSVYYVNMDGSVREKYEHVCGKIVDLVIKK